MAYPDLRVTKTLLFPAYRVAYIPVPKAACTSIKTALLPLVGEAADTEAKVHRHGNFDVRPFAECRQLMDDGWFVFTVVRHPVERALSAWRNKCGPAGPRMPSRMRKMGFRRGDDLDQFSRTLARWPARSMDEHLMPQSQLLGHAIDWPVRIFKFESLRHDWPLIADEIGRRGGKVPAKLPVRGSTISTAKNPQASMERLGRIYVEDFARFSYSQARPTAPCSG